MCPTFDGELLLAGGGNADDSWPLDEWLANQIGQGGAIGYLPVAMPRDRYPDCEEWITDVFQDHGVSDIRMWTDLVELDESEVATVNAIYVGGGNTYRLLDKLRQTDTDRLLREFVLKGGTLYGGSAGAIICGETIETTPDENQVRLRETTALQLLRDTDIWCHYTEADDSEIRDYVVETNRTIVAIPERSGVSVTATRFRVIGHVPIRVFEGSEKTLKSPDEQFDPETNPQ